MFETGIIKKSGNLHHNLGALYVYWKAKQYKTNNNVNEYFTISLSKSSGGLHIIDFNEHALQGLQIHLVFPGQNSNYRITHRTRIYQFTITRQNFEMFCFALQFDINLYKKNPVLQLTKPEFKGILYELKKIGFELEAKKPLYEVIGARTTIIFQEIGRMVQSKVEDVEQYTASPIVFNFVNLVDEKYKEQRTVEYYAKVLNIDPNYLSILTRKHMQVSALNIIQNRVLLEAKRLLIYSRKSVKAVMFELGFGEQSYFSYYFKTLTGLTPSGFRKKSREP